jgi:hypothetical protein
MVNKSNHDTFAYRPLALGHIRLLSISGEDGEFIYKLSHVDLASAPKYMALSYTWGDQTRDQDLLVNDGVLKVIQNIKIILPYLFGKYPSQQFWIDGICINQEGDREKEVQIPLMHKIYTQAAACIAWLGESSPPIEMAIPMIPMLAERFQGYDSRQGFQDNSFIAQGLPIPSSPIWAGLDDLFGKDWFTRVWTFQEAVLPENVEIMCSRHVINFAKLVMLARSMLYASEIGPIKSMTAPLEHSRRRAQHGMHRLLTVYNVRQRRVSQPNTPYPFLEMLSRSWFWKCSNPLDKIYGLLGLADQSLQEHLAIDYRKTPEEVYLAFAKYWIQRDLNLEPFHWTPPDHPLDLPTWCPNLNHQLVATPLGGPRAHSAQYCAGIKVGRKSQVEVCADSTAVLVEGFRVDVVAEVLPCPWDREGHITTEMKDMGVAQSLKWDSQCLDLSKLAYSTQDEVPDAHWRTLIANQNLNFEPFIGHGRESYLLMRILISRYTTTEIPLSPTEQLLAVKPISQAQLIEAQDYCVSIGYASRGRSYLSTQGGRVGLGPLRTEPGDVICIFYNGYTPYIGVENVLVP